MAGRAVRETVTLAGRAERARLARAFVEGCQAEPGSASLQNKPPRIPV
jgi:hypothetical protein